MLLTPALPVVYGEAYGDLVAAAYHLLQAHLTRVQKLRLSNLLRRAARQCIGPEHCEARCWLAHLAVRLGMFSECTQHLTELHDAARGALTDATAHFAAAAARAPRRRDPLHLGPFLHVRDADASRTHRAQLLLTPRSSFRSSYT